MKCYVTHKCGHEELVELFGKGSERQRKIDRMESEECPECRAEHAVERDRAMGLSELQGSPKQVAWASDIRQEMLDRVASEVRERVQSYTFEWSRGLMPENVSENYFGAQILDSEIIDVLRGLKTERSAKWFIDNRTAGLAELGGHFRFTSFGEMQARYAY